MKTNKFWSSNIKDLNFQFGLPSGKILPVLVTNGPSLILGLRYKNVGLEIQKLFLRLSLDG